MFPPETVHQAPVLHGLPLDARQALVRVAESWRGRDLLPALAQKLHEEKFDGVFRLIRGGDLRRDEEGAAELVEEAGDGFSPLVMG